MNYIQNKKSVQITEITLVVGVAIVSETYYVISFTNRECEFTKGVVKKDLE